MVSKIKALTIFPKGVSEDTERNKVIGIQVKILREKQGWTQMQLARKAKIGKAVIRRLEDGDLFIDLFDFFAVCSVFGVVPSKLLTK